MPPAEPAATNAPIDQTHEPDERAAADASRIFTAWAVQQVASAHTEPAMQLGAAAALRELASAGRAPIAEIATAGGTPALAALLSSDSAAAASKAAALVALRRLASQPALFGEVADAVGISACLQLLRGGNTAACAAAAAALLTSLAAGSEQHRREAVMQGAAPLMLQHVMNGNMQDGVWQRTDPAPDSLEFVAARALHTLHPGAPDTGLWHGGVWQTVSLLDSSGAAAVQLRAVKAVEGLADECFPDDLMHCTSPEQKALLLRQVAELELVRSIRLLLLLRAGAIPRLLSLVQHSSDPDVRHQAVYALEAFVSCSLGSSTASVTKAAAELIATGAVPVLLQKAGNSSDSGECSFEQQAAMRALVSLAEQSTQHCAALQSLLVPILVGWLQTCQDDTDVQYAAFVLHKQVSSSDAACRAAVQSGAMAALRRHSDLYGIPTMLRGVERRLQAFDTHQEQP